MSGHIAERVSSAELREYSDAERDRELRLRAEFDHIGDVDLRRFVPPGPVAQQFILSTALTAVIMGPLGGGKTTACTFKRILEAARAPIAWHPEDGKPTRMCRGIILRDTFRSAERTVLESWKQWFPKGYPGSRHEGGNDRPFTHTLRFRGEDGIRIEAVTEFGGLGENSIETLMKGREYSFGWLNEIDTMPAGALDDIEQRVGRYPKADLILTESEIRKLEVEMGRTIHQPAGRRRTVIGDMNAPTVDSWTYETLVTNRSPDRAFFQQPSGRSDEAENIFNLPDGVGYYERFIANQPERVVRRMVDNQFGYSTAGKPVYEGFDMRRHQADREIALQEGRPLHLAVDVSTAGLSPAALFGQENVRISVIDELFIGTGVGPARFGEALLRLLQERYPNLPRRMLKLWCDPAAFGGNDRESDQQHAADTIATMLGVPAQMPGNGSNEIAFRLSAMENEFRGYREPNSSILISPRCRTFLTACGGRYRFRKRIEGSTSSNEYEDMPEKSHPWSDIADAGQYLAIGIRGARAVLTGERQPAGQHWSSQGKAQGTGWGRQGGFDPHKAGL